MRRLTALLLVLALAGATLGAAGCGGGSNGSSASGVSGGKVHFAKTKFLIHAGLAFGAFHHFIYKPFRAGGFRKGAPGRTKALIKAGAAGLFTYHEVKIALRDAQSSKTLSKLVSPLTALQNRVSGLGPKLKGGNVNPGELNGVGNDVSHIGDLSSKAGAGIREVVPPTPGG